MIIILTLLYFFVLNIYNNNKIIENKKKLDDRRILGKKLLLSIYNNELKKYDQNFNKTLIVNVYGQKIFDKIFYKILKEKKIINSINKILSSDNLILLSYDKFIEKVVLEGLDPYSEVVSSLYKEINSMKNTANDEYTKLYNQNNIIFPFVIGPLHKINIYKLRQTIEKVILDFINNNINNFINFFNINNILINSKYITFIDNYIISEDKIKPFIIELLIYEYNQNIEEIKKLLTKNDNIIINNLCTTLGGKNVDNTCSYDLKDCKQMFLDSSENIIKDETNNIFKDSSNNDISNNIFKDSFNNDISNNIFNESINIFTTYKKDLSNNDLSNNDLSNNNLSNNKCLISAQSVLYKYVSNNIKNSNNIIVPNNDISYDFENEKVNLTTEYCKKKGLETTTDLETKNSDCKLTKNKSMLESVFGMSLLDTINTINTNNYEQCDINEIDGNKTNIIPNNLKELIKPLTKKYGPIEKSLCFDKTIGCPSDKKLVDGVCYNKCQDGYLQNSDKKSECYKLYATFENNGEFKNTDIITKKIINNPYLPINVCPAGYNYNVTEKKCIENCPNDYIYQVNSNCKKNDPVRWDGAKDYLSIKKNAIWSQSKVRVTSCLNPNKPELVDGLCYAKCPPGHVRVPGAPYTCRPEPCPDGYHKTGVNTCFRNADTKLAWYTKGIGILKWKCPDGYTNKAGICWADSCPSDYKTSTVGMCIKNCNAGDSTFSPGICNSNCPSGSYRTTAGMCMKNCNAEDSTFSPGICNSNCPPGSSRSTAGMCMKNCDAGYSNKAGICWADSCPSGSSKSTEGMCIKNCNTGDSTFSPGICNSNCPPGSSRSTAGMCMKNCDAGYSNKAGICWADSCPSGSSKSTEGMCIKNCNTGDSTFSPGICNSNCPPGSSRSTSGMCMKNCREGYTNVAGVCWANSKQIPAGTIPHKSGCPAGQRDDGTACWEDWKCNSWDEGKYNYTWGCCFKWDKCWDGYDWGCWGNGKRTWIANIKTSCTGCGCKKKELWDRQYCDDNKDKIDGLCYERCPPGYNKSAVTTCQSGSSLSYVPDSFISTYVPQSFPLSSYVPESFKSTYVPQSVILPSKVPESFKSTYVPESFKSTYVPESIPLPSTPAICPSDRDTIDGLCYPKCDANYYSSSPTTCETNTCPSNYYKTKLATCQLDAHTIPNPNIGVGGAISLICPEGTKEATPGGICYPDPPPVGYQRNIISLEQWTEKCPDEWTDKGWSCERPFKDVKKLSSVCPSNYKNIDNEKCMKECEPGYEFKDEKCVQICPDGTINNQTTCAREKKIINTEEYTMPYKYKIKKRKK